VSLMRFNIGDLRTDATVHAGGNARSARPRQ
jgi:hypothetical protein